LLFTARPKFSTVLLPSSDFAQTTFPLLVYLAKKPLELPVAPLLRLRVPGPGSKSAGDEKNQPAIYRLPEASIAIFSNFSTRLPPIFPAHTNAPLVVYFAIKISSVDDER